MCRSSSGPCHLVGLHPTLQSSSDGSATASLFHSCGILAMILVAQEIAVS